MQLNPRENFVITHQLNNSYITDTSYVRAVIRNAKTDAILATKNLTDQGNGRFTTTYQIPADVSGQGYYISIITSVYSDSGYTTKSQNYGDEANTYLVQERYNPNVHLGAVGGGSDIDYKKIRKIIKEEIDVRIDKIDFSKTPEVITVTKEVVVEKLIPQEKINFPSQQFIIDAIKAVSKKVDDKPVTQVPDVDFAPVMAAIGEIPVLLKSSKEELKEVIDSSVNKNSTRFKKMQSLKKIFDESFVEEEDDDVLPIEEEKKSMIDPRITKIMKNK